VPVSSQVYKWVQAYLMLGVTLRWTSIPSREEQNYYHSSHFMLLIETGISSGMMGHLACVQTLSHAPSQFSLNLWAVPESFEERPGQRRLLFQFRFKVHVKEIQECSPDLWSHYYCNKISFKNVIQKIILLPKYKNTEYDAILYWSSNNKKGNRLKTVATTGILELVRESLRKFWLTLENYSKFSATQSR